MYGDWPLKQNQRRTPRNRFDLESSEGKTVKHRTVACSLDIDFTIKRGRERGGEGELYVFHGHVRSWLFVEYVSRRPRGTFRLICRIGSRKQVDLNSTYDRLAVRWSWFFIYAHGVKIYANDLFADNCDVEWNK